MESSFFRNVRKTGSSMIKQQTSAKNLEQSVKCRDNLFEKEGSYKSRKERALERQLKARKVSSRGPGDSFNSKSGSESNFDLEAGGYLDVHLATMRSSDTNENQPQQRIRDKKFRGLNYDVIGDTICIRGESKQAAINENQEDKLTTHDLESYRRDENVITKVLKPDEGTELDDMISNSKDKALDHMLNYANGHRGSFPSDLHRINGEVLSDFRSNFGRLSVGSGNSRFPRPPLTLQSSRSSSHKDLSTTSSLCSDDSSEDNFDSESSRLNTVLDHIDPNRLHAYLLRKLKSKDRTTVLALSTLLPKKKFTAETMHCVRCHKEFDPKHGIKTCTLFHPEETVSKMFEDDSGADFECESCGTVFRTEGVWEYKMKINKSIDCGFCFYGGHTFEAEDVSYKPEGIAKTCEDNGCVVFYV